MWSIAEKYLIVVYHNALEVKTRDFKKIKSARRTGELKKIYQGIKGLTQRTKK